VATPASPADDLRCVLAEPIPSCSSPDSQFPPPPIDRAGRRLYYPLDYASVLSAAALRVVPGCSVLDVCAAPGGKSVAISQSLKSGGFLVCNEPDGDRRRRLTASLKEQCRLLHQPLLHPLYHNPRFPSTHVVTLILPFFSAKPSLHAYVFVGTMALNGLCSRSRSRLKGEIMLTQAITRMCRVTRTLQIRTRPRRCALQQRPPSRACSAAVSAVESNARCSSCSPSGACCHCHGC
jgi:hypothetical protein